MHPLLSVRSESCGMPSDGVPTCSRFRLNRNLHKRAAPAALISVSIVYFLVNIAYFAVVSKADILGSRQIIALDRFYHCSYDFKLTRYCSALFFRNIFGPTAEKVNQNLPKIISG